MENENGACNICGRITNVQRKYYYYDIKCDCCNNKNDFHFEIIWYCKNCEPKPPRRINVIISPIKPQEIRKIKLETIKK